MTGCTRRYETATPQTNDKMALRCDPLARAKHILDFPMPASPRAGSSVARPRRRFAIAQVTAKARFHGQPLRSDRPGASRRSGSRMRPRTRTRPPYARQTFRSHTPRNFNSNTPDCRQVLPASLRRRVEQASAAVRPAPGFLRQPILPCPRPHPEGHQRLRALSYTFAHAA